MADIKDFLNPTSMLTPGAAGGLTVGISMPVALAFGLSVKWLALAISFLLGSLIILAIKDPMSRLQRSGYCLLNSLIIFSTALGAGINIDSPPKPPSLPVPIPRIQPSLGNLQFPAVLGIATSFAQESSTQAESRSTEVPPDKPNHPVSPQFPSKANVPEQHIEVLNIPEIQLLNMYEQQQKEYQQQLKAYEKRWSW